ncbi:putative glycosyltransferase [Sesamum angolense]|uniref:Glycosyltransferase n=1 Tax=Sesamum angolense TaxID=2727404 RepID=A0AAE1WQP7_9LAMI|nr:putative glycosyltransferase [Sesamum angolense]
MTSALRNLLHAAADPHAREYYSDAARNISFLALHFPYPKLLSSFSIGGSSTGNVGDDHGSSNLNVSISLHDKKLRNEELSSAERRGFMTSGIHRIRYSRSEKAEAILAKARFSIREAARNNNHSFISSSSGSDYVPQGPIYHNANAFYRSYTEMEKVFKIYVYEEGEAPIFHDGPCRSIYTTEGRFIHEMERGELYRTRDAEEAHVYFMPFSVVAMVQYLYEPGAIDMDAIGNTLADYVHTIAHNHPFWNRSLGADHFMLSCHDWGPYTSSYVPLLFNNSIRVLCNANTSEGFNPRKDATLPEINLKFGEITGLLGGPPPSERSILAFFAGGLHGDIRHILLNHWKEKDPDIRVYENLPPNVSYETMLKNSKFCLCPSGYEVASPRVVEAIYSECVPVLISDHYVPPFSDVLNWKKFSVVVGVEDIPNIKTILMGISEAKYLKMQMRVKQVQRHFVLNGTPKRFDLFHMIVHSVWLRRLNLRLRASV